MGQYLSIDDPSIAILLSGRGSNMRAIVRACQNGTLPAKVKIVISNRPMAPGLEIASELGIKTAVVDQSRFTSRDDFDEALHEELVHAQPDWIALAGFMHILGAEFVSKWQGQIVNIHPSLLPRYPGLNTHARALEAGDKEAGASVHIVTSELDAGPVLAQQAVPIYSDDTPDTLAARVLDIEHPLYIRALKQCVTANQRQHS